MFGDNEATLMALVDEAIRDEVIAFRRALELRMVTLVREAIERSFVTAWNAPEARVGEDALSRSASNGDPHPSPCP